MLRKGYYVTHQDSNVTTAEEKRLEMHAGNETPPSFHSYLKPPRATVYIISLAEEPYVQF